MLLVEDDRASARALQSILRRRGCEVWHAGTLAEAASLLASGPDGIVLDLMLPDGDGSALLRDVRAAGLPIRIAVTTGMADRRRLDAVVRLGPDALLAKPIRLDELFRALGLPA